MPKKSNLINTLIISEPQGMREIFKKSLLRFLFFGGERVDTFYVSLNKLPGAEKCSSNLEQTFQH